MATHLDLEEQEQLAALKAFWNQYGNLITWVIILALAAFSAWNGWQWWQREQSLKASAMFDELEVAVRLKDLKRTARILDDMKERYPRTAYAQQAGLLAAQLHDESGDADATRAALAWVAENGLENEYRTVARLRLAGVLADAKQYDAALAQLDAPSPKSFEALIADRRGDVLAAAGRADEARAAYRSAWDAMDATVGYREVVEAKLTALGASPQARPGVVAPPAPGASK